MSASLQCGAKILYVDDTDAQRYALSRMLQGAGFEVIEASTGRQALQQMEMQPDLVVLDVNLPDMSGFEVCRDIKSREASARTPVLHVSATEVTTDARVTALEGGADGYLIQPIAPEELIATVRALLRVRKAEEALWRSNQQYRDFFEATPVPCMVFDTSEFRILAVNAAAVAKYGYSREEFAEMNMRSLVAEESWPALLRNLEVSPSANTMQLRKHRSKDGKLLDVEVIWAPLNLDNRDARLAIAQDISERLKRQAAEKNEAVRRLLLERVLQAQEEERQRISRELHDEAGQLMTSLLIGLRSISDARRLADARDQAQRLREIASKAIEELSRLARGLHSNILDDLGLEAALHRYIEEFSSRHGIKVTLELAAGLDTLGRNQQLNLFRIFQEALTNVARHAHATQVCITFQNVSTDMQVSIRDNGCGVSPEDTSGSTDHLGVAGMKQRAAMMGGALELVSKEKQGVSIELRIPLGNKASSESVVA